MHATTSLWGMEPPVGIRETPVYLRQVAVAPGSDKCTMPVRGGRGWRRVGVVFESSGPVPFLRGREVISCIDSADEMSLVIF